MNVEQLADYLINNDYEMQLVRRDWDVIAYHLAAEGVEYDRFSLKEAVELARQDPYIQRFIIKQETF